MKHEIYTATEVKYTVAEILDMAQYSKSLRTMEDILSEVEEAIREFRCGNDPKVKYHLDLGWAKAEKAMNSK